MKTLDELRQNIDEIDRETAKLFSARLSVAREISDLKRKNSLPIRDPQRENDLLARAEGRVDAEVLPFYRTFLREQFRISRAYQAKQSCDENSFLHLIGEDPCVVTVSEGTVTGRVPLPFSARKVLIVTDDGVPSDYVKNVAEKTRADGVFTFPNGESSKTLQTVSDICRVLEEKHFDRDDAVIAVGGGVVCDVAGFAAGIYLRGIDCHLIPTTLLAMADASIGGKCGVNDRGIKNQLGLFSPPRSVVSDPLTLQTLPAREIACGMAEIIKIAVCADEELFADLEKMAPGSLPDQTILKRAMSLKAALTEEDETEQDLRRILNFGHTLGHGIEATDASLSHGACVALGMIPMCSESVRERLIPLLKNHRLPTEWDGDLLAALDRARSDKKRSGEELWTVRCDEVGHARLVKTTPEKWREEILAGRKQRI